MSTPDANIILQVEQEATCRDIPLPAYQTDGAAGMDLRAAVKEPLRIEPGARALIPTGIRISVPKGFEAQVRPRSGLAIRNGIAVLNAPGTIDSDYRGPVNVILCNLGNEPFLVERGDRIAQMVVAPVERIEWVRVESVDDTSRGSGGFGHTGVK